MQSMIGQGRHWPPSRAAAAVGVASAVAVLNGAAWWMAIVAGGDGAFLGFAVLAYGLGLRHAFDADHIAAIDNGTRKLVEDGGRPLAGGLFFALGHSLVVLALTGLAVAGVASLTGSAFEGPPGWLAGAGEIGRRVALLFLVLMAVANIPTLVRLGRMIRGAGGSAAAQRPQVAGLLGRIVARLCGRVSRTWHLLPVGVLFALGFDTAAEVLVLGLSASDAVAGLSTWSMLALPMLFAAGMTAADALDGVAMAGAYRWALANPARRVRYNFAVTLLSVAAALVVGGIGLIQLAGQALGWRADAAAGFLAEHSSALGALVVAGSLAAWLSAAAASRRHRPALPKG